MLSGVGFRNRFTKEVVWMLLKISEILVQPKRRDTSQEKIRILADSIAELGLINAITVDPDHVLIAGLHRLEAVKLLKWVEIECNISTLDGLRAQLAQIDENFVRCDLSIIDRNEMVLRRKEIYEALHPETRNGGDRKSEKHAEKIRTTKCRSDLDRSFTRDTAEKLGVSPRTVERQVQAAKKMTEEAKQILRGVDVKITQKDALELSRLPPDHQREAANQLASGRIQSVKEYNPPDFLDKPNEPPFQMKKKSAIGMSDIVANLKNTEKDCGCTPDTFLAEITGFVKKFQREFDWYSTPYYKTIFPDLSQRQLQYIRDQFGIIRTAVEDLFHTIERNVNP